MFVNALLLGRARLAAMSANVHRGALKGPAQALDAQDKVIYPQCRTGVYPPTDFDPEAARRAARLPDARLELTFVYGYSGENLANNLFYVDAQRIVYFTAGVGIVYNRVDNTQQFFRGHTDDIMCLTLDGSRSLVASGQARAASALARSHARAVYQLRLLRHLTWALSKRTLPLGAPAGRQVGHRPFVCVWDPLTCKQLRRLDFPEVRGVAAVAFTPDGKTLVRRAGAGAAPRCPAQRAAGAGFC